MLKQLPAISPIHVLVSDTADGLQELRGSGGCNLLYYIRRLGCADGNVTGWRAEPEPSAERLSLRLVHATTLG